MEKLYVIYTSEGIFYGIYDDIKVIESVLEQESNHGLLYKEITSEMREKIISKVGDRRRSRIFDLEKLETTDILDSEDYFLPITKEININKIKTSLVKTAKMNCGTFIQKGVSVPFGDNLENFTYTLEDQINLKTLIDTKPTTCYYHSQGELDKEYTYDEIKRIYYALENNKNYNLIYTDVLSKWIMNNYEPQLNQEISINYGFTNEEITTEVNRRYAEAKLL